MPDARLTHPVRDSLTFEQPQQDQDQREAVASIAAEIGTGDVPLIHVETDERTRTITGRVTAPGRARAAGTDDWQQALANYLVALEAAVDEFQGEGYTLVDEYRDEKFPVAFHSLSWRVNGGQPNEFEFTADLTVGLGTMEARATTPKTAGPKSGFDYAARVAGNPLPGIRQMEVSREFDIETDAVFAPGDAENNQIIPDSGVRHRVTFSGTHTGTFAERAAADDTLQALQDGEVHTFETKWPGYTLDGKVLGYDSELQASYGTGKTEYTLTFLEGQDS